MEIFPPITISLKPELYHPILKTSPFKPGSTLMLKVLALRGDRALIDFGPFRANADIKIPVVVGEELQVRVQESGEQLKLTLLKAERPKITTPDTLAQHEEKSGDGHYNKIQTDLRQIVSQMLDSQTTKSYPKEILYIFNLLNTHFESLGLDKIISEIMLSLKSTVDNSGYFLEKMLEGVISKLIDETETALPKQLAHHPDVQAILTRDLKANLLTLKNIAEDESSLQKLFDVRSLATLRKTVDFLLTDITSQQDRAVNHRNSADPFQVFTYALPLAAEQQTAKLKIYYQKKQKVGSEKRFQISLLLSMDRLGDLRADFFLLNKDLTVTFFVRDQSIKAKIQEKFLELSELLNPLFEQIMLRIIVSEKKIKDFDHEDVQLNSDRRVDLRV